MDNQDGTKSGLTNNAQQNIPAGNSVNTYANQNLNAGTQSRKKRPTIYVAIAVIAIVIIAATFSLLLHSPSSSLFTLLSSNRNVNLTTMAQIANSVYSNTSELNISYSGVISGAFGSPNFSMSLNMPFKLGIAKYYNDSRLSFSISNVIMLGNMSTIYIKNANKQYVCTNSSLSSLSNLGGSQPAPSGYTCMLSTSSPGPLNLTQLKEINAKVHMTSVSQSSYKGQECVMAEGYITGANSIMTNSSNVSSSPSVTSFSTIFSYTNATFSTCLSEKYYLPLTMEINASVSNKTSGISLVVKLEMNETSLSTSTSPAITSLPGPIRNTTYYNTTVPSTPSTSYPTGPTTPTTPIQYTNSIYWKNTTPYFIPVFDASCITSSGYIYCVGGDYTDYKIEYNYAYYAQLYQNGSVGQWKATTPYPVQIASQDCVAYSNYIYCSGGLGEKGLQYLNGSVSYYAPISSSGIGLWKNTTASPITSNTQSCVAYSGYIYCLAPEMSISNLSNRYALGYVAYYAPLSAQGIGAWQPTDAPTNITPSGIMCAASSGYIYCVGGINFTSNNALRNTTEYAPISSKGIGKWVFTTDAPFVPGTANNGCSISNGYMYCVNEQSGAYSNSSFYAPISSSGIGTWAEGENYPLPYALGHESCAASSDYVYCVGGIMNNSASESVYYSKLNATGATHLNTT